MHAFSCFLQALSCFLVVENLAKVFPQQGQSTAARSQRKDAVPVGGPGGGPPIMKRLVCSSEISIKIELLKETNLGVARVFLWP